MWVFKFLNLKIRPPGSSGKKDLFYRTDPVNVLKVNGRSITLAGRGDPLRGAGHGAGMNRVHCIT